MKFTMRQRLIAIIRLMESKRIVLLTLFVGLFILVGCQEPQPTQTPKSIVVITPTTEMIEEILPDETIAVVLTSEALTSQPLASQTPSPSSTPVSPACDPPEGWVLYTIELGDTLLSLAARTNTTVAEIKSANCKLDDKLIEGDKLYLPFIPPTLLPPPPPPSPPQAIPTEIPSQLLKEISYATGGAKPDPCRAPDNAGDPLQFTISPRKQDKYQMCVYVLPTNETITATVELYDPDGNFVGSNSFPVDKTESHTDDEGITETWSLAKFDIWMPVGVPIGEWRAIAKLDGDEIDLRFDVEISREEINILPLTNINPLEQHTCVRFQSGEQAIINGVNFVLQPSYPLGFYMFTGQGENLELLDDLSLTVTPDTQGGFSIPIEISGESGGYLVVLVTNTDEAIYQRVKTDNDCYIIPEVDS